MRKYLWRLGIISFVLLLCVLLVYVASVVSTVSINSTNLTVYRDGLVHVEQTLSIGEFAPQAPVALLSNSIENLIVLDENELTVDYQLTGDDLVVYSLGASQVKIEYDLITLTIKENEVWTLLVNSPYSFNLHFPVNSTIIYLSKTPSEIDTTNSQLSLSLGSGDWEISYVQQVISGTDNAPIPEITKTSFMLPVEYLVLIIAAIIAPVTGLLLISKKKHRPNIKKALNANPQLMKEDREVLEFLAEKEGKAFESEIRQRFPEMPRTSLWRLIKRLEKLEIVEVKKIGLENQVLLKK